MKHDLTSQNGFLSRKIKAFPVVLGWLLCTSFSTFSGVFASPNPGLELTAENLHSLPANEVVVIDTRSRWKYLLGHIPDARHAGDWQDYVVKKDGIPGVLNPDKSFLAAKLKSLGVDKNKTVVLYGEPTDKWRTDGRFFWMMEYLGFSKVAILEGGLDAWSDKNFDVERGLPDDPAPSQIKESDIQFNDKVHANAQWIYEHLKDPNVVLIDNRERKEYLGSIPYGSPRGGHIPGAIHIDWREFFTDQGRLKPRTQLDGLLKKYGIHEGQQVVVYCTGGVRSGMAYYVFRLLGFDVRNYDGSWWDWSHRTELPVES